MHVREIVAVDPGVHECGIAVFANRELVHAELADTRMAHRWLSPSEMVYIEMPQIYPGVRQKGDQNDLLRLAVTVGTLAAHADTYGLVKPHEWKGQHPKAVTEARCLANLSVVEYANVYLPSAKSKHHNVWDAVGLGLWALGRY